VKFFAFVIPEFVVELRRFISHAILKGKVQNLHRKFRKVGHLSGYENSLTDGVMTLDTV
jgi:hypothetical protein